MGAEVNSHTPLLRSLLMTTDTVGGVWHYSLDLIRELAPYGIRVKLFAQGGPLDAGQRAAVAALDNCDLHETQHKLEWMDGAWPDVDAAGEELQTLAQWLRPDLIHFNEYSHAARRWECPTLVVGHSCVYSWFDAVKATAPGGDWGEYWRRVRAGLGGTTAIMAPSQAMAGALEKHYGPTAGVTVVHNGRDARDYHPGEKQPYVLGAGRLWDDAKNVRTLALAAPALEWPVRLAGCNRHPQTGQGTALESVELLGELDRDDLTRQMAHASIFAAPARYEPFGLTILEAALCGCALVLGDIPSLRELWGDAALFVRPDDAGALTAAINQFILFPELRTLYGSKARRRARRYNSRRQVRCYLAAYRQLLASAPESGTPRPAPPLLPIHAP